MAAAAALRAAALSEQQWLLASQADLLCAELRGSGGGGSGGARLVATLERWAAQRAHGGALRAQRGALLTYLAECERATQQLATHSKAALRQEYGLLSELNFDRAERGGQSTAWQQLHAPLPLPLSPPPSSLLPPSPSPSLPLETLFAMLLLLSDP